jgi:hypothetical protein
MKLPMQLQGVLSMLTAIGELLEIARETPAAWGAFDSIRLRLTALRMTRDEYRHSGNLR